MSENRFPVVKVMLGGIGRPGSVLGAGTRMLNLYFENRAVIQVSCTGWCTSIKEMGDLSVLFLVWSAE